MEVISTHWGRLWLWYRFLCIMFSKGTSLFDFKNAKESIQEKGTQSSVFEIVNFHIT